MDETRNSEIKKGTGKFYLGEDPDHAIAEITFTPTDDGRFIIDRTYVSPSLQGQGIGRRLVEQVVALARQENRRITPHCSYARKVLETCDECRPLMVPDATDTDTFKAD